MVESVEYINGYKGVDIVKNISEEEEKEIVIGLFKIFTKDGNMNNGEVM